MIATIKQIFLPDNPVIPVVMFHSVGLHDSDWVYRHISEPLEIFEEKIIKLKQAGYHFIFWSDLYGYMAGKKQLPRRVIMLTFDDGYLDNWVLAYPILKKYGAKGTIFISPEFVDPSEELRNNLDDVWTKKNQYEDLLLPGFLNWSEMRTMEQSGVIDIQSHACSHTWYFCSDKIVDFHRPNIPRYPWLAWNTHPERKPYYMLENQEALVPYGYPIYQFEKSLICRRYFPPDIVINSLIDYVSNHGGKDFFKQNNFHKNLNIYHQDLLTRYKHKERLETESEYFDRICHELTYSKNCIEEQLNKKVEYICWPGGGYTKIVTEAAKESGYKAWTLSSRDNTTYRNQFNSATPHLVKRIGSSIRIGWRGRQFSGFGSADYFLKEVERHQGNLIADLHIKFYKLKRYFLEG